MHIPVSRCRRGFSLIELLVVIAVIAIMATIFFAVSGRARDLSHVAVCSSNLRQLGSGMMIYVSMNEGRFPDARTNPMAGVTWFWDAAVLAAMEDAKDSSLMAHSRQLAPYSSILYCPADFTVRAPDKVAIPRSYTMNPVIINYQSGTAPPEFAENGASSEPNKGMQIQALRNPGRTAVLLEKHDGLNTYNSGSHFVGAGDIPTHGKTINVLFGDGSVRNMMAPSSRAEAVDMYLGN